MSELKTLKEMLKEMKEQTKHFKKMAVVITKWQQQDKHYHKKTLNKMSVNKKKKRR